MSGPTQGLKSFVSYKACIMSMIFYQFRNVSCPTASCGSWSW